MRKRNAKEKETVAMLLDPSHYYGESGGHLGPVLIFLCASGAPALIYVYYGLFRLIPVWLFITVEVIWTIYMGLLTIGKQKQRVAIYKKQVNDEYALTNDLLKIKMLHDNGIIEMLNGKCKYIVVCTNPTVEDTIEHTFDIRDFQLALLSNVKEFDIDCYNDVDNTLLDNRYSRVNKFRDKSAAETYVSVVDYQREMVKAHSTKVLIVYTLTFPKYDWKVVTENVQSVLNSELARVWKEIKVVDSVDEVNKYLARDIYGSINIDEMNRKKYCTNNFLGAKILGYDDFDKQVETQVDVTSTAETFIPVYNGGNK